MRQVGRVNPCAQDMGKAPLVRMAQRRGQSAQGAESGFGPVANTGKARLLAPADDDGFALRGERRGDPVDQARALPERLRLVAAEAARLSARENGSQKPQSNASVATPWAL
ncbi:MAG: hypothetical protein OHK0018_04620 [Erythrobacter tepidarius]